MAKVVESNGPKERTLSLITPPYYVQCHLAVVTC